MTLIEDLTGEHLGLLNALQVVRLRGIGSPEAREALAHIKRDLAEHVRKEEVLIYAPLRRVAEQSGSLQRTLEIFADDLDELTKELFGFFDKYENGGPTKDFPADFGAMAALFKARIRREETVLFKEYERTVAPR